MAPPRGRDQSVLRGGTPSLLCRCVGSGEASARQDVYAQGQVRVDLVKVGDWEPQTGNRMTIRGLRRESQTSGTLDRRMETVLGSRATGKRCEGSAVMRDSLLFQEGSPILHTSRGVSFQKQWSGNPLRPHPSPRVACRTDPTLHLVGSPGPHVPTLTHFQ